MTARKIFYGFSNVVKCFLGSVRWSTNMRFFIQERKFWNIVKAIRRKNNESIYYFWISKWGKLAESI